MERIGLGEQFVKLFSEMSVVTFILLVLGIMLVVTEFFSPARGVVGALGALLLALGVAVRMLAGGTLAMLFLLIAFIAAIVLPVHLVMMRLHKHDWLAHALALAVSGEENPVTREYSFLKGHAGIATTDIDPKGHMAINDINFFVTSLRPVKKGAAVIVTEVCGDRIVVEQTDMPEDTYEIDE